MGTGTKPQHIANPARRTSLYDEGGMLVDFRCPEVVDNLAVEPTEEMTAATIGVLRYDTSMARAVIVSEGRITAVVTDSRHDQLVACLRDGFAYSAIVEASGANRWYARLELE